MFPLSLSDFQMLNEWFRCGVIMRIPLTNRLQIFPLPGLTGQDFVRKALIRNRRTSPPESLRRSCSAGKSDRQRFAFAPGLSGKSRQAGAHPHSRFTEQTGTFDAHILPFSLCIFNTEKLEVLFVFCNNHHAVALLKHSFRVFALHGDPAHGLQSPVCPSMSYEPQIPEPAAAA